MARGLRRFQREFVLFAVPACALLAPAGASGGDSAAPAAGLPIPDGADFFVEYNLRGLQSCETGNRFIEVVDAIIEALEPVKDKPYRADINTNWGKFQTVQGWEKVPQFDKAPWTDVQIQRAKCWSRASLGPLEKGCPVGFFDPRMYFGVKCMNLDMPFDLGSVGVSGSAGSAGTKLAVDPKYGSIVDEIRSGKRAPNWVERRIAILTDAGETGPGQCGLMPNGNKWVPIRVEPFVRTPFGVHEYHAIGYGLPPKAQERLKNHLRGKKTPVYFVDSPYELVARIRKILGLQPPRRPAEIKKACLPVPAARAPEVGASAETAAATPEPEPPVEIPKTVDF